MENLAQQENTAHCREQTVVNTMVMRLAELGVENAFGVIGGAVAQLYDAVQESTIAVHHFRHETGAAFAAAEAYFATGAPTVVFATTGPGTLNVITGITAAKWEGAKVILLSGCTSAQQRGRWATQETSSYTLPQDALYGHGPIFDFAIRMEHPEELAEIMRRICLGLTRPGGFIAHISVPISLQAAQVDLPPCFSGAVLTVPSVSTDEVAQCAELLQEKKFAVWVGFGARHAASAVRDLVERAGAVAFCSPRAKGIVPENHPCFLGVTGLGGHSSVREHMQRERPDWILVLGSRLGEATSYWDTELQPTCGFIHVDLDPEVPGSAYPHCQTIGIQAEIGQFLEVLLTHFPEQGPPLRLQTRYHHRSREEPIPMKLAGHGPVRPQALMQAIQEHIVEGSDALVMSECGNAFAWCNHYLRFSQPGRYRVSTLFGSMGHYAAGVVGAALARRGKTVAVVGDGSMLMNSEVSTAAQYRAPAVWIVLNDAAYGICEEGQRNLGLSAEQLAFPQVDFVALAKAVGADGIRVETEDMLSVALEQALAAQGPFVVDVHIDPNQPSLLHHRFQALRRQAPVAEETTWQPIGVSRKGFK